MKQKIIIDTDPGHDDALALMLLGKSNQLDILAITTVAGNTTIEKTTNNARYIADLISLSAPIYSGADKPLSRSLVQAVVHGEGGLAGAQLSKQEPLTHTAVDKIIELVRKYPHEVSIVILGPQTNIAEAFIKDPELPQLIKELVIMGGAITVPGNKNRVAEFNIFVDPEAADIVFSSSVKKIVIPLDACNDIFLTLTDFETLHTISFYPELFEMMKHYIKGIEREEKVSGALMYDPLAAYYLLNPSAYTLTDLDIQIETQGTLTRGMTVADRRIWGDKMPNVKVAMNIDGDTFIKDFLKILKN